MPSTTITREVDDLYNPDPDATIEVEIVVSFSVALPDRSIGENRITAEDIYVESTDSDLCNADQAEAWLFAPANWRELELVHAAAEDENTFAREEAAEYRWRAARDDRAFL